MYPEFTKQDEENQRRFEQARCKKGKGELVSSMRYGLRKKRIRFDDENMHVRETLSLEDMTEEEIQNCYYGRNAIRTMMRCASVQAKSYTSRNHHNTPLPEEMRGLERLLQSCWNGSFGLYRNNAPQRLALLAIVDELERQRLQHQQKREEGDDTTNTSGTFGVFRQLFFPYDDVAIAHVYARFTGPSREEAIRRACADWCHAKSVYQQRHRVPQTIAVSPRNNNNNNIHSFLSNGGKRKQGDNQSVYSNNSSCSIYIRRQQLQATRSNKRKTASAAKLTTAPKADLAAIGWF